MPMAIIEFILVLISHAAAGIYAAQLKYSKKVTYCIWGGWIALEIVLMCIAEFELTNPSLKFIFGFVFALIGQYLLFFATTRGRLAQRIFMMLTYSIFFCIAMALFNMVKGTLLQMKPLLSVSVHFVILFSIVAYFLGYVCPLCRAAAKNIANGWQLMIFANGVFLIAVVLSTVFPRRIESFFDPSCITYIFLSISIMVVYPVIFSNINNMSQVAIKREIETQNKLLLAQIEAETMQREADSQARHDRRHHNLVMLEFANNNDIESVREYLRTLVAHDTQPRSEAGYCDHLLINTILAVYESRARESGVQVHIQARAGRHINVSAQDLVVVIANLFENAINAASAMKGKNRQVHLTIRENAQRLMLMVENPCDEKLLFDENSYGVGLRSVISTVHKYEGMYDFSAAQGMFSAKVSLNLP